MNNLVFLSVLFIMISQSFAMEGSNRRVCVESSLRAYPTTDFIVANAKQIYGFDFVSVVSNELVLNERNGVEMIQVEHDKQTYWVANHYLKEKCPNELEVEIDHQFLPSGSEIERHVRDISRPHTWDKGIDNIKGLLYPPVDECRPCGDFKKRRNYFHPGTDLCTDKKDTPTRAIYMGVVVEKTNHCKDNFHIGKNWKNARRVSCRNSRGFGNRIMLMHQTDGKVWYSGYHHLDDVYVNVGDTIFPGEIIGTVGSTGVSFNYHLHFEIMEDDNNNGLHLRNNPAHYFDSSKMCQRYFFTKRN